MGKRISDETIERINQLYYEIGIKSQVAKIVGCSPATVTKYIRPDYKPILKENSIEFNKEIKGCDDFIREIFKNNDWKTNFLEITFLNDNDKADMEVLRKEIM